MLKNPIYKPKGAALEYADYALNIYTECPHGCTYCYARAMAKRFGKPWTGDVKPREGIVEATEKQLASGRFEGKTIHLCFSCDPYPMGFNCSTTTEVIKLIKVAGANVQILTKGNVEYAERDFEYLDSSDNIGVTLTGKRCGKNSYIENGRIEYLRKAAKRDLTTWVSCEPILSMNRITDYFCSINFIDEWHFGKLKYDKKDSHWSGFIKLIQHRGNLLGRNYKFKESLRKEME